MELQLVAVVASVYTCVTERMLRCECAPSALLAVL